MLVVKFGKKKKSPAKILTFGIYRSKQSEMNCEMFVTSLELENFLTLSGTESKGIGQSGFFNLINPLDLMLSGTIIMRFLCHQSRELRDLSYLSLKSIERKFVDCARQKSLHATEDVCWFRTLHSIRKLTAARFSNFFGQDKHICVPLKVDHSKRPVDKTA